MTFPSSSISGVAGTDQQLVSVYRPLSIFLNTYDYKFLQKNIEEIDLLRDLKLNGVDVGGLSNGKTIFVCLDDYGNRDLENKIYINTLNHEFSSNIYKKLSYIQILEWKMVKNRYYYTKDYLNKCLRSQSFSEGVTEDLLSDGFLKNYSLTNDENDFNVYAEKMFTDVHSLSKLGNRYPKILLKINLLKMMYRSIGYSSKFPDELDR